MACTVCKDAIRTGNNAVDESYDNFERFYYKYMGKGKDKVEDRAEKRVFEYLKITAENHTRLLELAPGCGDEPISCSLQETSIDDPPRYSALSYTWGSYEYHKRVLVDGKEFLVTDNLWTALWHLRLKDKSRTIWIDAICIDQSDVEERNRVVSRMKDIYERADEILAWLGPESSGGSNALIEIAKIYDHYSKLIDRYGTQEAAFQHMLEHGDWYDGPEGNSATGWYCIDKLLSNRTWFHRVWIVQEGTTPVRTTFHLCNYKVPAEAVYEVFRLFQRIPNNIFPRTVIKEPSHTDRMAALTSFSRKRFRLRNLKGKSAKRTEDFPLLDTLNTMRNHSASDPHDKVYAALGFATDIPEEEPVTIDYRKSFAEMLKDVAVSCVRQREHNLRFLGHAGLLASGHIPATWIPDWLFPSPLAAFPKEITLPGPGAKQPLFNACGINHAVWDDQSYKYFGPIVNGNTLKVPGILVDYVRTTSIVAGQVSTFDSLENAWILSDMDVLYPATNEIIEAAYLRTLVADLKMQDGEIAGRGGSMYWRNRKSKPANHADIEQLMRQVCGGRKFLTTLTHGYIGLGPLWALPGDAIFMLKGGEMMYLARPTLQGTYHYVGEAYVHGMMDGAVLDRFNRGDGTMQLVEFEPVLHKVLDSNEDVGRMSTGNPVIHNYKDVGFNIRKIEYSHPYEDMRPVLHTAVGPRAESMVDDLIAYVLRESQKNGEEAAKWTLSHVLSGKWVETVEPMLLQQIDEDESQSSTSKVGFAGRNFAKRSYIKSAIAIQKGRIEAMNIGQMRNVMEDGQVLLPAAEKRESSSERSPAQQISDDERLARQLQEEEYSAQLPSALSKEGPGPKSTPAPETSSEIHSKLPLLFPRKGPPVRLMQSVTHAPHQHAYQFQTAADFEEFSKEMKEIFDQGGTPPVLWGKWVSDPKKRPKVEIATYGHPGRMWWEDENGNEVDGPEDFGLNVGSGKEDGTGIAEDVEELRERGITFSNMVYSQPDELRKEKEWGEEEGAPPDFPIYRVKRRGRRSWRTLVMEGGWEGEGEAEVPEAFALV